MRAKINDIRIAYNIEGREDVPVLVFSHSLATSGEAWRYQLVEFTKKYRVLTYDMRGHGDSDAPDYPYDFDLLADDVVGLLRHIGIQKAVFVGLSIGGMIGQALALRYPNVFSGIVIANASSKTEAEGRKIWEQRIEQVRRDGIVTQVPLALERWFSPEFRQGHPEIAEWVADMIQSTPVTGFVSCARAIMNLNFTPHLHKIALPILILTGEMDGGFPPDAAKAMVAAIPGAKIEIIPHCRHQTAIEAPALFNRALQNFLDSIGY